MSFVLKSKKPIVLIVGLLSLSMNAVTHATPQDPGVTTIQLGAGLPSHPSIIYTQQSTDPIVLGPQNPTNVNIVQVPEPSTFVLLGLGLVAVGLIRLKRKR